MPADLVEELPHEKNLSISHLVDALINPRRHRPCDGNVDIPTEYTGQQLKLWTRRTWARGSRLCFSAFGALSLSPTRALLEGSLGAL